MKSIYIKSVMQILMACILIANAAHAQCKKAGNAILFSSQLNHLQIDTSQSIRKLEPSFFGFNLEWVEFQLSLWDKNTKKVNPEAVKILQSFPGAVYRYPGGHNSNHLDWHATVGPMDTRPFLKQVSWLGPIRAEFGLNEYLQFVEEVSGTGWYVANLYGGLNSEGNHDALAESAKQLAEYIKSHSSAGTQPNILRWELGNELDRANYRWPPEKFTNIALKTALAIRSVNPNAKFAHLQQEYPAMKAAGYSQEAYSKTVRSGLSRLNPDYTMHFYYDGAPNGPPINYFIKQACNLIEQSSQEGHQPNIWITEHARIPPGAFVKKDWKNLWPGTANLQAAISIADMYIESAKIPEIKGAFIHALHASDGPWPMMHVYANKHIVPSMTLLSMRVLRSSMLPNVLASQLTLASSIPFSDDAIRAMISTDQGGKQYSLWVTNRSSALQPLEINFANLKGQSDFGGSETLTAPRLDANNYEGSALNQTSYSLVKAEKKQNNVWVITLPPYSVSAVRFNVK